MRRMITSKQQEFVEDLAKYIAPEDFQKFEIDAGSNDIEIQSDNQVHIQGKYSSLTGESIVIEGDDHATMQGSTDAAIYGGYSSEIDDCLNSIEVTMDGITFYNWSDEIEDYEAPFKVGGGLVQLTLPTSDPGVEGALWNDNGTLKISAGGN